MKQITNSFSFAFLLTCTLLRGQPQLVLQERHMKNIESGFFSHDGKLAYTVSPTADRVMKIWDVNSGKLLKSKDIAKTYYTYFPSKIDNSIFAFSQNRTLDVLDSKGDFIFSVPILDLYEFDKNAAVLVNKGDSNLGKNWNRLQIYDLKNGKLLFERKGDTLDDNFYKEGVAGYIRKKKGIFPSDSLISFYHLKDRKCYTILAPEKYRPGLTSGSPEFCLERNLIFLKIDNTIDVIDYRDSSQKGVLKFIKKVDEFMISNDGNFLIVQYIDKTKERFSVAYPENVATLKEKLPLPDISGVDFSSLLTWRRNLSNSLFKFTAPPFTDVLYDIKKNALALVRSSSNIMTSFAYDYDPAEDKIVYITPDNYQNYATTNEAYVMTIGDPEKKARLNSYSGRLSSVAFSPKGDNILTTGFNNYTNKPFVQLYSKAGQLIWEAPNFDTPENDVYDNYEKIAALNDSIVMTVRSNRGLRMYNLKRNQLIESNENINCVAISGDKKISIETPKVIDESNLDTFIAISVREKLGDTVLDTIHVMKRINLFEFPIDAVASGSRLFFDTNDGVYEVDLTTHKSNFIAGVDKVGLSLGRMAFLTPYILEVSDAVLPQRFLIDISRPGALKKRNDCDWSNSDHSQKRRIVIKEAKLPDGDYTIFEPSLIDLKTKKIIRKFSPIKEILKPEVMISPDDAIICFLQSDWVSIYKADDPKFSFTDSLPYPQNVVIKKFDDDSHYLYYTTTDRQVKRYDFSTNKLVVLNVNLPSAVNKIEFAPNHQIMLMGCDGGYVILYDLLKEEQIASIIETENTDYEIILNDGHYFISGKTYEKIGFVEWPNYFSLSQLDLKYNRPDLVLRKLGSYFGGVNEKQFKSYHTAWENRMEKLQVNPAFFDKDNFAPTIDIVNKGQIEPETDAQSLVVKIRADGNSGDLMKLNICINEVPLFGKKGLAIEPFKKSIDTTLTLLLSAGLNKIEVSATNSNGIEGYRKQVFIKNIGVLTQPEKLWFIGIGAGNYKAKGQTLAYALKDIEDIDMIFKAKCLADKTPYHSILLLDENATAKKILSLKDSLRQTGINDKVIVAFSGHGLLSEASAYYLGTIDVDFEKPEQNGLLYQNFEDLLDAIPSRKKLILIDACNSGETIQANASGANEKTSIANQVNKLKLQESFELMKDLFVDVSRSTGTTIISAAQGLQSANESNDWENGAFTYAIKKGLLQSKADANNDKQITLNELKKYINKEVVLLTNGKQQPATRSEFVESNWVIWSN